MSVSGTMQSLSADSGHWALQLQPRIFSSRYPDGSRSRGSRTRSRPRKDPKDRLRRDQADAPRWHLNVRFGGATCIHTTGMESSSKRDAVRRKYEEWRKMRHGITWMGAIVALFSFTASHAESDPVAVTRSFLGAWAASSVDELMGFMATDAVVVGSTGAKFADEASVRQVIGRLKGLQNREIEVRLDGDRVAAHGKTWGYVPY